MHILSADLHIVGRVLAVQHKFFFFFFNGPLNHVRRHSQPSVVAHNGARPGACFDTMRRGVAKAYLFENSENIILDGGDSGLFEWFEMPAGFSRVDRLLLLRKRCLPLG